MMLITYKQLAIGVKMSRRIVIFDIDGTLANLEHRRHLVRNGNRKWDQFFEECVNDTPFQDVVDLNKFLSKDPNVIIILVSGRSDSVMPQTIEWLRKHDVRYEELHMRKHGDYRKDFVIKKEILGEIKAKWIDCDIR